MSKSVTKEEVVQWLIEGNDPEDLAIMFLELFCGRNYEDNIESSDAFQELARDVAAAEHWDS